MTPGPVLCAELEWGTDWGGLTVNPVGFFFDGLPSSPL